MPLWGRKKSEAESGRQHGAEARSIPGWLATDPFSGVAGFLNRWAVPVLWEALDEKVTPLLVEDAVESVKLRGAKLELKAAGQVGWLFLSALRTVYRKTLTQDAEIRKLWDEVAALQERQLHMKETIESAVTLGDQMEARTPKQVLLRMAILISKHMTFISTEKTIVHEENIIIGFLTYPRDPCPCRTKVRRCAGVLRGNVTNEPGRTCRTPKQVLLRMAILISKHMTFISTEKTIVHEENIIIGFLTYPRDPCPCRTKVRRCAGVLRGNVTNEPGRTCRTPKQVLLRMAILISKHMTFISTEKTIVHEENIIIGFLTYPRDPCPCRTKVRRCAGVLRGNVTNEPGRTCRTPKQVLLRMAILISKHMTFISTEKTIAHEENIIIGFLTYPRDPCPCRTKVRRCAGVLRGNVTNEPGRTCRFVSSEKKKRTTSRSF
ncbi:hypothetical protein NDU88_006122 [Pleurodeles waltl]|uniref:Uncharacterized protein n=1 Tax=Pleurodeles waltl TaxID=8319 RepID=A0AAV7NR14_PLEWA|nr:hypothetical protein NDU88_006122 [Pleurodeles waltl]